MTDTPPWADIAVPDGLPADEEFQTQQSQQQQPVRTGITCLARILQCVVIGYNVLYIVVYLLAALALIFTSEGRSIRDFYSETYGLNFVEADAVLFFFGVLYCLLFGMAIRGAIVFQKCFLVPGIVLMVLFAASALFQTSWFVLFIIALPSLLAQIWFYRVIKNGGVTYTIA